MGLNKNIKRALIKILSISKGTFLFLRCFVALVKAKEVPQFNDEFMYRGLDSLRLGEFIDLYRRLNLEGDIKGYRKLLLKLFSKKCVIAVYDGDRLIAVDFFYFNFRDLAERTIHEGFIGVDDEYQRKGIATKLRNISTSHFSSMELGISTRISTDNYGSMSSAIINGFSLVETYLDNNGVERNYLVFR